MLFQTMYFWTYCNDRFVNKRFEKWDSRSRCQVLEQKDWELSLEIKSNEYISVFPLIFQFPFYAAVQALINRTCNSSLQRIYKDSYFLFLQLITYNITYHWSFVSYNLSEYLYFYKMKTYKISCRKVKISISSRDGNFQFSARGERYVYLKISEFHLAYV